MEFTGGIISVSEETYDVRTFRIRRPKDFDFIAGQYGIISFLDRPEFSGEGKPFTLSSSPTEKEFVDLTIKEIGSFTRALFTLKAGSKLRINGPKETRLSFDGSAEDSIVFLAGGSGITPFMSIIRYAVAKKLRNKMLLIYSNKTERDIIYRNKLEETERKNKNIRIINTITDDIPPGWLGEKGRINRDILERYVKNPAEWLWYICGPPLMVNAMKNILKEMNVPEEKLRIEEWQVPGKS